MHRDLARQLDIDHRTVKKSRTAGAYPEAKPRVRESMVDDYANCLDQRLSDGCRSSTRLWRELREQGFRGQVNAVRYWLRQRRTYRTRAALPPQRPTLRASPRQVVWFILKEAPSARDMLEQVYRTSPELGRLAKLAQSFFRMFKDKAYRHFRRGLKPHVVPSWLASPQVSKATSKPYARRSGCRGAGSRRRPGSWAQAHQTPNARSCRLRSPAPARPPVGPREHHSERHVRAHMPLTKCAPEPFLLGRLQSVFALSRNGRVLRPIEMSV